MDYLRGKLEKWIFNERHQNLFKSVYSVVWKWINWRRLKRNCCQQTFFYINSKVFEFNNYLLLCKVWKHKVNFYQTYLVNVLYGQAYGFEMIVYKWTNKIDPSPITLPYDMNSSSAFMRSLGEAPIIVIRSKNSKLHIITFILFKITPNNLDKQLIFGDN